MFIMEMHSHSTFITFAVVNISNDRYGVIHCDFLIELSIFQHNIIYSEIKVSGEIAEEEEAREVGKVVVFSPRFPLPTLTRTWRDDRNFKHFAKLIISTPFVDYCQLNIEFCDSNTTMFKNIMKYILHRHWKSQVL